MRARLAIFLFLATYSSLLNAAAPVKMRYQFTADMQTGGRQLHVAVDISGLVGGETELTLPSSWGGAAGLTHAVKNLKAESAGTEIVDTAALDVKILRGFVRGRARFSYDLVQDWDGPLRESVRYRVHLQPKYIEVNTNNALVYPRLDSADSVDCSFAWKVPKEWSLATSFGVGPRRQRYRGAWDAVENAVFVAGDFRVHKRSAGKGQLFVAVRGQWSVPDEEMISKLADIIRLQKAFWKDDAFPYFLVTLVPFAPGQGSSSGGGGFTNAFSLHAPPETGLSPGVVSLISHEMFHTWNPFRLGRIRPPAERMYWFTEGVTTYYQDLLLWRAGLMTDAQYVDAVNRVLRDYHLSPDKNVPLDELVVRARQEQSKSRISYERGAAIALWLDATIRARAEAKASLDTMLSELLIRARRAKRNFPDLTLNYIAEVASQYIGREDVRRFRSYVEDGVTIEVPARVTGYPFVRRMVDIPVFELGMDSHALVDKKIVAGLKPGSNAELAGLREGDAVSGMSVTWNDTSKPVKLTIVREGMRRTVQFYPRGQSIGLVPQYVLETNAMRSSFLRQ